MNVNPLLDEALTPLLIPVYPDHYIPPPSGGVDEYIVYNYADERPILRGGGVDIADETTVQVHYFTLGDPMPLKKTIQTALRGAGFTIQSIQQMYESDTHYYHVIVEAYICGIIRN